MDINLNSNGNSEQVGNLTVLIGSDPFLPQLNSPRVEPEVVTVEENLNTPPPLSVTLEYSQERLTMAQPRPMENWLKGLTLQISLTEKNNQNSPKTLLQNQILK